MAKRKQKGGRKPVEASEKVILVGFYIKRKYVEAIGGMKEARELAAAIVIERSCITDF